MIFLCKLLYIRVESKYEIGVLCFITGKHFPLGLPGRGPERDYYGMPFTPKLLFFFFSSFFLLLCSVLILLSSFIFLCVFIHF